MSQELTAENVGGILDIIRLWRGGTIADAMELWDAIKAKDPARIRASVVKIAGTFGYGADAKEIDDIVAGVMAQDWPKVVYEAGDAVSKFAVNHMGYLVSADGGIRVMAPPHIETFTGTQARTWLADNRSNVRAAGRNFVVKFRLRNAPVVAALMAGDATTADLAGIDPETLDRIINICRAAIPLLTIVGAFFPPCLIAATVLKFIVAWYDANHPQNAMAANAADKGLSLSDLL